ncbi:hypothetical protein [Bowmanella dokdonensis]|uniref:Uncharacterized protein n=1 Tax=Bowmanella dokdonensis TaxID=751969 RepID=A0A939DQF0_9ALTE|nr:hypothetical protein [Bowmanella dokdonensis]MBN7826897.1 hypothetical protein [Bowmanella dokdonensis]
MNRCLIALASLVASQSAVALPPILDYYPGCDYQALEVVQVQGELIRDSEVAYQQSLASLLNRMQIAAQEKGANALIIEDLHIQRRSLLNRSGERESRSLYQYQVLPILSCQEEVLAQRKDSKYDSLGQLRSLYEKKFKGRTTVLAIQKHAGISLLDGQPIPETAFFQRPEPEDLALSVEDAPYDLSLGLNRMQVIDKLGYPSAEFRLFKGVESLLYGRRHWLHFSDGRLIRIDFTDRLLSYDLLNRVPPLPVFDEFAWHLKDSNLTVNSSLENVRKLLSTDVPLNAANELLLEGKNSRLSLRFDQSHQADMSGRQRQLYLVGFSIESLQSQPLSILLSSDPDRYQKLHQGMEEISRTDSFGAADLLVRLGTPIGRVYLQAGRQLDVFDNHLLFEASGTAASRLYMQESLFGLASDLEHSRWKLTDNIHQGQRLSALKKSLGDHLYVENHGINLSGKRYDLKLFLEGEGNMAQVLAAEVVFY